MPFCLQIEYIEFERHGSSTLSTSFFDLIIRLRGDIEHQFRNVHRNEYHVLFTYFR